MYNYHRHVIGAHLSQRIKVTRRRRGPVRYPKVRIMVADVNMIRTNRNHRDHVSHAYIEGMNERWCGFKSYEKGTVLHRNYMRYMNPEIYREWTHASGPAPRAYGLRRGKGNSELTIGASSGTERNTAWASLTT